MSNINKTLYLSGGTHTVTIRAVNPSYRASNFSTPIQVTVPYSISYSLTGVSVSSEGNMNYILPDESLTLNLTEYEQYELPLAVNVTGATATYNKDNKLLVLSNPSNNITVEIVGEPVVVGYTVTIINCASSGSFYDGVDYDTGIYRGPAQDGEYLVTSGYFYWCPGESNYNGGTCSGNITAIDDFLYKVDGDGTISGLHDYTCIIKGTPISLADGSFKLVEDITMEDELLVWNFYTGKFDKAKPIWIQEPRVANYYNLLTFEDGRTLGLVGPKTLGFHRIYNDTAHQFTHTGCADTPNGIRTFTSTGHKLRLKNQEVKEQQVTYYNIITDTHYNLFANGILTSCRLSNRYEINPYMKYNTENVIMSQEEIDRYLSDCQKSNNK